MGCGNCASGGGCGSSANGALPAGCQNNGACMTSGCNKLDVYDWLSDMDLPSNYKPFEIVEVRFKGSRKDFYLNTDGLYLEMGEMVVVEPSTGSFDIGHVSLTGELVRLQLKKNNVDPESVTKKIYRKAHTGDVEKWQSAKDLEWETMHKSRKLALDLGLSMKISDVDYQGDKTKATFYYTAEGRVDFRELIKKMAESFRIRIEMRQIGMRQEASRLGGIGSCGRELCCSTWLTDFKTVSTSAARYQNLSLNTLKLAGQCGKLKCCLNFELDNYMDSLKDMPTRVEKIETELGVAYLQKTDIFKKIMWFSYAKTENWIPLAADTVKEYSELNKNGIKPKELARITEETEVVDEAPTVYDYENVVGQDSLTRLDEENKKKRRRNKRSKNLSQGRNTAKEKDAGKDSRPARGNRPARQNKPAPEQTVQKDSPASASREQNNNRRKSRNPRSRNRNNNKKNNE